MNDEVTPGRMVQERQEGEPQRERKHKRARKENKEPSHFGYATFIITFSLIALGVFLSGGMDQQSQAQAVATPVDALNVQALSTSWSCPIAGTPSKDDTVIISNLDEDRTAQVNVVAHSPNGEKAGTKTFEVQPSQSSELALSDVTTTNDSSLYIESFSGAVSVFRSLDVTDGQEYVKCDATTSPEAYFTGLETIRNANAFVVLANPYAQPVVVDVNAQLIDSNAEPIRTVLDEKRGVIIPSRGRAMFDLQTEFGRYPIVNLRIESRSGFFSAEVLQSYTGAHSVTGETIVLPSEEMDQDQTSFVPGISPQRIVGYNADTKTHSISLEAFASDKRFVTSEPVAIMPSTAASLPVPGTDFGLRALSFSVEKSNNLARETYVSWFHLSAGAVSSGDGVNRVGQDFIVPATASDTLYIFNPAKKESTITISYSSGGQLKTRKVAAQSYAAIDLGLTDPAVTSIVRVSANRKIFIGAGDLDSSRYTTGINLAL